MTRSITLNHVFVQVVSAKSPKIVSLEELDEWEECSDLDEDCELVEIEDEDEEEEDDVAIRPTVYFQNHLL